MDQTHPIWAGSSSIRAGYYFFPKYSSKVFGTFRDVCRLIAQIMSFISSHVWSLAPEGWMVYQVESCGYRCNILTPCVECTDRFRHRSTIRLEGHHHHPSSPNRDLENPLLDIGGYCGKLDRTFATKHKPDILISACDFGQATAADGRTRDIEHFPRYRGSESVINF
jgi:hypothetical protein